MSRRIQNYLQAHSHLPQSVFLALSKQGYKKAQRGREGKKNAHLKQDSTAVRKGLIHLVFSGIKQGHGDVLVVQFNQRTDQFNLEGRGKKRKEKNKNKKKIKKKTN
jgi:hypothetical protein